MSLTCPNCGNAENFLVKMLHMHLLRVTGGQLQPPQEEGRPAMFELLCDECDSTVDLDGLDEGTRRDLLTTLGARQRIGDGRPVHDYFDILGVPGDAPASEVRRWSARRVRRSHPDFSDSAEGLKSAHLPAAALLQVDTAVDFAEMAHVRGAMLVAFFACDEHDTGIAQLFRASAAPIVFGLHMRVHFDVLGWLYVVWGLFGILTGLSLIVLSLGTTAALLDLQRPWSQPEVWLLAWSGAILIGVGSSMILVGRALGRRAPRGRLAALILAVPNLLALPFGSALGIYTFWTLLNDDARREFGRPTRSPDTIP